MSIYRSLDPARHEIRLLRLHPETEGGFDSPIRGELIYRFLDNSGDYEALTYFWGEKTDLQKISLDGQPVSITKNLELALRYLRRKNEERVLWVDALCINQDDVPERSHQVSLMKDVYQSCTRDIAWLGPYQEIQDPLEREKFTKRGMDWMKHATTHHLKSPDVEWSVSRQDARGLRAIFQVPRIWSRVWVMQELSCAREVLLVYANEELDWKVVERFLGDEPYADAFHLPFSHGSRQSIVPVLMAAPQAVEHQRGIMREVQSGSYSASLLDVLARFKDVHSTDPRDRIYGLLGLVTENHGIRVGYSRPVADVFADVTLYLINSLQNLDIICQNPWTKDRTLDTNGGLPSWIPDYADEEYTGRDADNGFSRLLFAQRSIFSAGRATCAAPQVDASRRIHLRGARIAKLGPIRPVETPDGRRQVQREARDTMLAYFGTSLRSDEVGYPFTTSPLPTDERYPVGETARRAFWRTLVMDCTAYPIRRLGPGGMVNDTANWDFVLGYDGDYEPESMPEKDMEMWERARRTYEGDSMLYRNYDEWVFVVADNGLFCMVRGGAREGDVIAVLDGAKVPVVLREKEGGDGGEREWAIVCVAYVHGYMDGEAVERCEKGELTEEDFVVA